MKIAAVTNNGKTISTHFGQASHYVVVTVEDGKVTAREMREKMGHQDFIREGESEGEGGHGHGRGHGCGGAGQKRHARMISTIADCDVLVSRGMGRGIYEHLKREGIPPYSDDCR